MIQTTGTILVNDPVTVTVRVFFEDNGMPRSGIDSVRIITSAGVDLPVPQPFDCPFSHSAVVGPVPRTELPLWAETRDCSGEITPVESNGPLFDSESRPDSEPEPGTPMPCLAEVMCPADSGCAELEREAMRSYEGLAEHCGECAALRASERREREKFWGWMVLGLAMLVVAMIFVAQGPWGAIGALFWAAAGAYLIYEATQASIRADRLARRAEECEEEMSGLRDAFNEAVQRIELACCPHCVTVPLTEPSC